MNRTFDRKFHHAFCVAISASYKLLARNCLKIGLDRIYSFVLIGVYAGNFIKAKYNQVSMTDLNVCTPCY